MMPYNASQRALAGKVQKYIQNLKFKIDKVGLFPKLLALNLELLFVK